MRTLHGDIFEDSSKPWGYMAGHKGDKAYMCTKYGRNGPGGLNCPCCTLGNPGKFKPLSRRTLRRKLKQELSKESYNEN